MKVWRIIVSVGIVASLAAPLLAASASNVTQAVYKGTISITNSSNATITNGFVAYTLNTNNMISSGYMNASGNNTATQMATGTDTAYQFSANGDNNSWVYVPSIASGATTVDNLYTGGSLDMGSKLSYFPGAAGMTRSDNATIELGDNFTIEQSGFVDLANTGANFTSKDSAFRTYVSGSSNITAEITGGATVTADNVTTGEHIITVQAKPDPLAGYGYRKQIPVNGTTAGNQTSYQMPVTFLYAGVANTYADIAIGSPFKREAVFQDRHVADPVVITDKDDATQLIMYWNEVDGGGDPVIWRATTSIDDPRGWDLASATAVMEGTTGQWDEDWARVASIVTDNDTYYMYYAGYQNYPGGPVITSQIGLATSSDGINWTKYASNPIYSYGDNQTTEPSVIKVGSTWYLYFAYLDGSFPYSFRVTTSTNGMTGWTAAQTVKTGGWNSTYSHLEAHQVYQVNDGYVMVYESFDPTFTLPVRLGLAHSATATGAFTDYLATYWLGESGVAGTWDAYAVATPYLKYITDRWYLFYAGTPESDWVSSNNWDFGVAEIGAIPLNSHSQTDFDDLRFTTDNGTTELDYWLEEKVNSSYAKFWVELDSVPASPTLTAFYAYYGNASATSNSSASGTWVFYDDASADNSANYTLRDLYLGGGTHASFAWIDATDGYKITMTGDDIVMAEINALAASGNYSLSADMKATPIANPFNTQFGLGARYSGSGVYYVKDVEVPGVANAFTILREDTPPDATPVTLYSSAFAAYATANTSYPMEFRAYGSRLEGLTGHGYMSANVTDANYASGTWGFVAGYSNTVAVYFKNVRIRNYAYPEPMWGMWGDEENMTTHPGGLSIYIDGVLADNATLSGVAVPDNGNAWTWVEQGAMPYVFYQEITVGGTLVQDIEGWENDTTFHDVSGYDQDTTPSFRASGTAGLTAVLTSFGPISSSQAEPPPPDLPVVPLPPDIASVPDEPSGMYTELAVTFVGADFINGLLDAASIPRALFWFPFFMVLIILLSFVIFWGTKSTVLKAIMLWLMFMLVAALGGWGWWLLIPLAIELWAAVMAMKKVGW